MELPLPEGARMETVLCLEDQVLVDVIRALPFELRRCIEKKISPVHVAFFYHRTGILLKYEYDDFARYCVINKVADDYNCGNWILTFKSFAEAVIKHMNFNALNECCVRIIMNAPDFNHFSASIILETQHFKLNGESRLAGTDLIWANDENQNECWILIGSINFPALCLPRNCEIFTRTYEPYINMETPEVYLDLNGFFYFLRRNATGSSVFIKDLNSDEGEHELFSITHNHVVEEYNLRQTLLAVDGDHIFVYVRCTNTLFYHNSKTKETLDRRLENNIEVEDLYAIGWNAVLFHTLGALIVDSKALRDVMLPVREIVIIPGMRYRVLVGLGGRSFFYSDVQNPIDDTTMLKIMWFNGEELVSRDLFEIHTDSVVIVQSPQIFSIHQRWKTSKYFMESPGVDPILFHTESRQNEIHFGI